MHYVSDTVLLYISRTSQPTAVLQTVKVLFWHKTLRLEIPVIHKPRLLQSINQSWIFSVAQIVNYYW